MMMMITTMTIIATKIREAAVTEEDHESRKGGGGMIHYTPLAFQQVNLEGFDVVAMHVARAVPPGSRVFELYRF